MKLVIILLICIVLVNLMLLFAAIFVAFATNNSVKNSICFSAINCMPADKAQEFLEQNIDPQRCTCLGCSVKDCLYRYDLYNFDGDCLLAK